MPEVNPLFQFHKLNEKGQKEAQAIAGVFSQLLEKLEAVCPVKSREFAIVRTKLEEACFFAKKSIAIQPENHA